jgi:hypothetical protein
VTRQIAAFVATRAACQSCGRLRGIKDHKTIVFRTLFGNLVLVSPRLRRCPCQRDGPSSASLSRSVVRPDALVLSRARTPGRVAV